LKFFPLHQSTEGLQTLVTEDFWTPVTEDILVLVKEDFQTLVTDCQIELQVQTLRGLNSQTKEDIARTLMGFCVQRGGLEDRNTSQE